MVTELHTETESTEIHANGVAHKRRGRLSAPAVSDVLADLRSIRSHAIARLKEIGADREGLNAEQAAIEAALGMTIHAPSAIEPAQNGSPVEAKKLARKPPAATNGKPRGPRADSLSSRVLAWLKEHPAERAPYVAKGIGAKSAAVHSALQALAKAGKASSTGARATRVWSAA